jgi:hypothetical protein
MKTIKTVKTVRLTTPEIYFLAGALSHSKSHYKAMIELKISDILTKAAEDDLKTLEAIKKKIGIQP